MGSASDWPTMQQAVEMLDRFGVPSEHCVVSAHRTPERLREYASGAADRGLEVIIAGAGGAAHLPGMVAAWTTLPVLGVPVKSRALSGMDSLLSIVQMPKGVPVGTLAIGDAGAANAGLLAARDHAVGGVPVQGAPLVPRQGHPAGVPVPALAQRARPVHGRWCRTRGLGRSE